MRLIKIPTDLLLLFLQKKYSLLFESESKRQCPLHALMSSLTKLVVIRNKTYIKVTFSFSIQKNISFLM